MTATTVVQSEGREGTCVLWGDPHINVFDNEVLQRQGQGSGVRMLDHGDYWLVRSAQVVIQGRYWSTRADGAAATRALAVGGPFLEGHVLIVEPMDGRVTWDGRQILQELPSEFEVPGLLVARFGGEAQRIRDGESAATRSVDLELPLGVRITVNRWRDHIDVMITMQPLQGGQDGHCGNFNGDPSDDTEELIAARMGAQVPEEDCLFLRRAYRYVGCFEDTIHQRDLPIYRGLHMQEAECALACSGSQYFGRQWRRECWCGDSAGSHGRVSDSECACDSTDIGDHRNCVYEYEGPQPPPPRPDAVKVNLTLARCAASTRAEAERLCRQAVEAEGGEAAPDFLQSCVFDVCFAGREYARQAASMQRQMISRALASAASHPNMRFAVPAGGEGLVRWATHPERCLQVAGGAASSGSNLQLGECREDDPSMRFTMPRTGLGQIRWAAHPSFCLDVAGGGAHSGSNVQLWRCSTDHPNMRFAVPASGAGHIRWASHQRFCLDVSAGGIRVGTNIQLWRCE